MDPPVHKQDHSVPDFPFKPGWLSAPPEDYAARRAGCPAGRVRLRSGHEAVLLVTFADALAALGDTRLTHDLVPPGSPRLAHGRSFRDDPDVILNKDGAEHRRIRRLLAPALSPSSAERWRPEIRSITSRLIDQIEQTGPRADLVSQFCARLPVLVMGRFLGVPERDTEQFQRWSDAFALSEEISDEQRAQQLGAFADRKSVV